MEATLPAPFGHVKVTVNEQGRTTDVQLSREEAPRNVPDGFPSYVIVALEAYLDGRAPRPVVPAREEGTAFQRAVWRALADIEPGETVTYGELADELGKPGAARAVGQALRRNPLPLVNPCHRVVSTDGLGGFGGLAEDEGEGDGPVSIKRWLLDHEAGLEDR